jgi:hypothetical protein
MPDAEKHALDLLLRGQMKPCPSALTIEDETNAREREEKEKKDNTKQRRTRAVLLVAAPPMIAI